MSSMSFRSQDEEKNQSFLRERDTMTLVIMSLTPQFPHWSISDHLFIQKRKIMLPFGVEGICRRIFKKRKKRKKSKRRIKEKEAQYPPQIVHLS